VWVVASAGLAAHTSAAAVAMPNMFLLFIGILLLAAKAAVVNAPLLFICVTSCLFA
jgi:hypothetical protein